MMSQRDYKKFNITHFPIFNTSNTFLLLTGLNPVLLPLEWLLGTWESDEPGEGCFPTIKPFRYTETLNFSHVGQPVINFMSVSPHILLLWF